MELLISAVVTLLVQLLKWLKGKFGAEMTKTMTLILAFILSVIGTFLYQANTVGMDFGNIQDLISVFGVAMAYYEIVVKRLIIPALDKLTK